MSYVGFKWERRLQQLLNQSPDLNLSPISANVTFRTKESAHKTVLHVRAEYFTPLQTNYEFLLTYKYNVSQPLRDLDYFFTPVCLCLCVSGNTIHPHYSKIISGLIALQREDSNSGALSPCDPLWWHVACLGLPSDGSNTRDTPLILIRLTTHLSLRQAPAHQVPRAPDVLSRLSNRRAGIETLA